MADINNGNPEFAELLNSIMESSNEEMKSEIPILTNFFNNEGKDYSPDYKYQMLKAVESGNTAQNVINNDQLDKLENYISENRGIYNDNAIQEMKDGISNGKTWNEVVKEYHDKKEANTGAWVLETDDYSGDRVDAKLTSPYANDKYAIDFGNKSLQYFNSDNIKDIMTKIKNLQSPLSTISKSIGALPVAFGQINDDTKTKLSAAFGTGESLKSLGDKMVETWGEYITNAHTNLENNLEIIMENDGSSPTAEGEVEDLEDGEDPEEGGKKKSSKSGSHDFSGDGASDSGNSEKPSDGSTNQLVNTVFGTLSFAAIVPLYSQIGQPSTIQSKLNGNYDVLGIVSQDGKYYYKIYDKELDQIYYTEISKDCNLKTEYKEVLKDKEPAMMLKQPEVGEDVLAKMTDPNEVYFVNGTTPGQGEVSGINFANVTDSTDGNNYYVPMSDSVEVVSLDEFTSSAIEANTAAGSGSSSTVNVG